jgi:hypothetical protein
MIAVDGHETFVTKVCASFILAEINTRAFVMYSYENNGYKLRYVLWNNDELHVEDRRGHTKETGNRNATAISENCYQPELNTWN